MTNYPTLRNFSQYFSNLDLASVKKREEKLFAAKHYERVQRKWKVPLERKKRRKAAKMERMAKLEKRSVEEEKLVAHDPEQGISLPAVPEGIFAIFQVGGSQYKVTKDDKLLCDKLPFEVGQRIEFDKVLLIGTKDYTSVGRPYVNSARVIATIEEQTQTKKLIIYKKKRRKDYQRNKGHRQCITVLHIDNIIHNPTEETLKNYHFL